MENKKNAQNRRTPTGREITFSTNDLIVSKTDIKGRLTYVNEVFTAIAGYKESELIGQPHSIIRHPEMPRCVFKLLWEHIQSGKEIFAYVNNMAFNGDHYWVFAHVTPSLDADNNIIGYHSSRRVPEKSAVNIVAPLYKTLLAEEHRHGENHKAGLDASYQMLLKTVSDSAHKTYDRFIFAITIPGTV